MHEDRERHQHIPPPDPHHEKDARLFKPVHVVLGALALIAILVYYIVMMARGGN
jgi:hypothetical protein